MTHVRTAALTAAALTIVVVIGLSLTAAADTPHSCPPPSAQLAAAQGNPLTGTDCSEPAATTPGADPANPDDTGHTSTDAHVIEPLTGTTTVPRQATDT
jgi:hypothetical protein